MEIQTANSRAAFSPTLTQPPLGLTPVQVLPSYSSTAFTQSTKSCVQPPPKGGRTERKGTAPPVLATGRVKVQQRGLQGDRASKWESFPAAQGGERKLRWIIWRCTRAAPEGRCQGRGKQNCIGNMGASIVVKQVQKTTNGEVWG